MVHIQIFGQPITIIWGFPKMGVSPKWLVYKGKSHLEMDDERGTPYFRKPPYPIRCSCSNPCPAQPPDAARSAAGDVQSPRDASHCRPGPIWSRGKGDAMLPPCPQNDVWDLFTFVSIFISFCIYYMSNRLSSVGTAGPQVNLISPLRK